MRHQKTGRKLGRNSSHRKAMYRNMVTSLFKYGQLETTDAKAKELRPIAEKLITLAKKGDLHSRRLALSYMNEKSVTHKLFDDIKNGFLNRQGGYLRVLKNGFRRGDGAAVSIVQLLPAETNKKKTTKKSKPAETKSDVESKAAE
jgi:large subunit ribosomal protein L17